ncbi:MAG: response regulator [Parcubacteria group bacterium]
MIIEDDYFVLDIYHTKLTQEGFEVLDAKDGGEGLEKLRTQEKLPDLILLDIIMPNLGGLDVLGAIKQDERLRNIPIILLTNLSQKDEIDKGLELGATDYLIKSHFTPSEVLEKINSVLSKA